MTSDAARPVVVVTGYVVRFPLGGMTLVFLPYLQGLRDLGFEPVYVETADISGEGHDGTCYDPDRGMLTRDATVGLAHLRHSLEVEGLGGIRWWYRDGDEDHGMSREEARATLAGAAVVIDVAATCWAPELELASRHILVDCDAPFTQIRMLEDPDWAAHIDRHDVLATYAVNLADGTADVPSAGRRWVATLPPVDVASWTVEPVEDGAAWTTVTSWASYGSRDWDGRRWHQKDVTLERIVELPDRIGVPVELALAGAAPRDRLRAHGWRVVDPVPRSRSTADYRSYLADSRGEIGIAKDAFVQARTGAFNNRTAAYLAAGRPAVVSDTGLSWMGAGTGLRLFRDVGGAARGIRTVEGAWDDHAAGARERAERWFSAPRVLTDLLRAADVPLPG
ncbi:MAG: hypothetical protein KY437_08230 [Actinobacteria bacterium]|nr:hypothetical protein [Actinomycetota bacterium]